MQHPFSAGRLDRAPRRLVLTGWIARQPYVRNPLCVRTKRRTMLARALRNNMIGTEQRLWSHLRGRQLEGWKFRRQHPIGEYIVDFVCLSARLVVELDGYSHGFERQLAYDEARRRYLKAQGYRVLTFSGDHREPEFMEGVVGTIYQELTSLPSSGPPPARRGRTLI